MTLHRPSAVALGRTGSIHIASERGRNVSATADLIECAWPAGAARIWIAQPEHLGQPEHINGAGGPHRSLS